MAVEPSSPSSPNRRERSKAQTRQRVIDAARDLFMRHGYEAVTIKMIADAAGVAVGSVFTTLPSKSSVLEAIIIEALNEQLKLVDGVLTGDESVVGRLSRIFHALYAFHDSRLTLMLHAISHSWLREPEAEAAVREGIAPLYQRIAGVLREARERGEIESQADVNLITDTLFHCYLANYRRAAYDAWAVPDLAERMERHIRLVLGGAGLKA